MTKNFDSRKFIRETSEGLISSFDKASRATTPGLIGAARESTVRTNLESLLPTSVGVGSGCVIDHQGNSSRQQDVILFEKHLCPVFSINDTPETTYYPCEGVIAVGEIKSEIGKVEVEDCFSKIESVKKLRRLPTASMSVFTGKKMKTFRNYLNMLAYNPAPEEQFDQDKNVSDQIYGFVLCGKFAVKADTLCGHIGKLLKSIDVSRLPNLIASLHDGIFSPYDHNKNTLRNAVAQGTGFVYGASASGSFEYLLTRLHQAIRSGRTVGVEAFERYLIEDPNKMQLTIYTEIPL